MAKPEPAQRHRPVLRDRVVELLEPALAEPGSVCVDGTLGMGGHAEGILERCPEARVVGIDRDQQALDLAGQRLAPYADRITLVHAVYDEFAAVVESLGLETVDAALFDLGVSSLQLDEEDRGFAYRVDAPLDMRMDQSEGLTAAEVLNHYDVDDLTRILRDYGEERFARPIARAVVQDRDAEPFSTSGRLVDLLRSVIPAASQRSGGHPAKRTFQALRIEVNRELAAWETALPAAIDALGVGGRIAVLSYHSLEDRITKRALTAGARSSTPAGLPVELPEHAAYLRLLTRGAEEPSPAEVAENPRAASARLRAAERVRTSDRTGDRTGDRTSDRTRTRGRRG
ncbi:MAG TPA: 16S rRNA (cytosine(1402)-N(4))-methyltransferase RsmH [Lapillicoccus sp.]|jgi:16S rRNA (cytosine1402-N4)-methyltransferase